VLSSVFNNVIASVRSWFPNKHLVLRLLYVEAT
jgi:hypothetical protein